MSDIKISKSAFLFSGKRYFRAGSEAVSLADCGERKTPLTQAHYLAREMSIATGNLAKVRVDVSGPFSIEWSKYSSTDVNASISYLKLAGGTGAFNHTVAREADLVLVKFELAEGPLKTLLNEYAGQARKYLDDEGNDGRIVSAIFVVMEAKLGSRVTNGGSVSISAPVGGSGFVVGLGASGSSTQSSEVVIPPNTSFAYLLHKVKKWDQQGDKRIVVDMEDDQPGPF